jgi:YVTN family beta-propeller protein
MKTKFANLILCLTLVAVAICTCVIVAAPAAAQSAPTYSVVRSMVIGGDGGWDYVYADSAARRLYVARATRFMVVDLDSGKVAGEIPDTPGAHGVALVPDLGIGFTTNGRENTSSVFDLKTLKVSEKIKTGEGPDAIVYDSASGHVFIMDGHGKAASVIDPQTRRQKLDRSDRFQREQSYRRMADGGLRRTQRLGYGSARGTHLRCLR